jgi:hypothetical protein
VGFIEAFDEGAGEVSAFRDWEGKSFFQKFGGFLGHGLIITRNMVMKARLHAGPTRIIGAGAVGLGLGGDVSSGVAT